MSLAVGWGVVVVLFGLLVPRVRRDLVDIVEYRWSRHRMQRRLPRARLR